LSYPSNLRIRQSQSNSGYLSLVTLPGTPYIAF
jgi:hypothetical protein